MNFASSSKGHLALKSSKIAGFRAVVLPCEIGVRLVFERVSMYSMKEKEKYKKDNAGFILLFLYEKVVKNFGDNY